MTTFEIVLEISKGLLTPTIGAVGVYIAWQQQKSNQLRLKLDRYDRRLAIYVEVKKILSIIARDAAVSTEELLKFISSVAEADFLFGPEISQYVDEIYRRGLNLWRRNTEYKERAQARSAQYDHDKVVSEMNRELEWLTEQFEPAKQRFRKYLDISD